MAIATHTISELKQIGKTAQDLGASVEIVGHWVWAKFTAKPNEQIRNTLKQTGYHWSRAKSRWYFAGAISNNVHPYTWKKITSKYKPVALNSLTDEL